jgi:GAF domain-containing protein
MNTETACYHYLDASGPLALNANGSQDQLLLVALALNQGGTAADLLDLIFETLDPLVPFDRIGIARVTPEGILHLYHVRSRLPVTFGQGKTARLEGSSLAPIVRERKIRIIDDMAIYALEHPQSQTAPQLLAEGLRSSLTLPLTTSAGPVGVVFFSSAMPHAYAQQHVEVLQPTRRAFCWSKRWTCPLRSS